MVDVAHGVLSFRNQDGRTFAGADVEGIELEVTDASSRTRGVRIVGGEVDALGIGWYELVVDGAPACAAGELGVFVPGRWTESGEHLDEPGAISFSCRRGAIAKCVAWGYAPWSAGSRAHQTCTRVARADFCGDGRSFTVDGTPITVSTPGEHAASGASLETEMEFEAGWNEDGAVCVNKPRFHAFSAAGEEVLPSCFADKPACDGEQRAASFGALIASGSKAQALNICSAE
jgi:hypothetical protein